MVMGQEERKNKAKLEKTQISVATSNTEYETAVKMLEETTARWNREWKAAADKFQDLEEERLDFSKSSLWTFANIASTVCVSDDASCEKIRLSLEKLEVERDIASFIQERGTGQEIPDPPKYINFCRGDLDSQSDISEDENYSVAQFPRSINPAYRTSSPQPSTYESHHDPNSALARDMGHEIIEPLAATRSTNGQAVPAAARQQHTQSNVLSYDPNEFAPVPHDPYPMDGMTMLCRTTNGVGGPQADLGSQLSSQVSSQLSSNSAATSARPSSRDSHSDFSNLTPYSSQELPSGKASPVKAEPPVSGSIMSAEDKKMTKKKSGFFQNHSPFRRKSTKDISTSVNAASHRNTWHPAASSQSSSSMARSNPQQQWQQKFIQDERAASPDPIDANASLALNIGQNVFPVSTPDRRGPGGSAPRSSELEPADDDLIAQALAELKGVTLGKQSSLRMSADHYHGISTPAPNAKANAFANSSAVAAGMRGTPPPSYDQQVQRLGVPSPAVTSKAMKQTSQKFVEQTRSMFSPPGNGYAQSAGGSGSYQQSPMRASTRTSYDMPRAASPAPRRSASPRPGTSAGMYQQHQPDPRMSQRSASPNPYASRPPSRQQQQPQMSRGSGQYSRHQSPNNMSRAASPSPYRMEQPGRPRSSVGNHGGDIAVQVAPYGGADDGYGSQRSRGGSTSRPGTSNSNSHAMGLYEGGGTVRSRSKSVADSRQFTRDGRPIMHLGRFSFFCLLILPLLILTP